MSVAQISSLSKQVVDLQTTLQETRAASRKSSLQAEARAQDNLLRVVSRCEQDKRTYEESLQRVHAQEIASYAERLQAIQIQLEGSVARNSKGQLEAKETAQLQLNNAAIRDLITRLPGIENTASHDDHTSLELETMVDFLRTLLDEAALAIDSMDKEIAGLVARLETSAGESADLQVALESAMQTIEAQKLDMARHQKEVQVTEIKDAHRDIGAIMQDLQDEIQRISAEMEESQTVGQAERSGEALPSKPSGEDLPSDSVELV